MWVPGMLPLRVLRGEHVCSSWILQYIVYQGPERLRISVSECSLVLPDSKYLWPMARWMWSPWSASQTEDVNASPVVLLQDGLRSMCHLLGKHLPHRGLNFPASCPGSNSVGTTLALLTVQGIWAQGRTMGKLHRSSDLMEIGATKTVSLFGMQIGFDIENILASLK